MKKGRTNILGMFLLLGVLCIVPLIVSAYKYQIGLKSFPWFSNSDTAYDFFLYWKGQALILLCGFLALYTAVKLFAVKGEILAPTKKRYLIPIGCYFVCAVLSALLSEHSTAAIWGNYEQWEGLIVLGCYAIVLLMAYGLTRGEREICILRNGLLAGVFVLSLVSALQCFGYDFFRTEAGQWVMNFMNETKLNFKFNFEVGRVYSTLHNPNYVGSYVALMLPIVLSMFSFSRNKGDLVRSAFAGVTAVFLLLMLLGSESVTGCIGVVAPLVPMLILLFAKIRQKPIRSGVVLLGSGILMVVAVCINRPIFEYGINKITNPTPNQFVVEEMSSQSGALEIQTTQDDRLTLSVEREGDSFVYQAVDEAGQQLALEKEESTAHMKFQDTRFEGIELWDTTVTVEGEEQNAFVVDTPSVGKAYTIVPKKVEKNGTELSQTTYQMYNPFEKLDDISGIPHIGFEENQHFGSRRGYIWSRTLPLLKDHVLVGSGPSTFVYEFPNDDYLGMKNVGYDGQIVTKPHNMFLQIFVQTGLVSLAAYLVLYVLYFAECMRLYRKKIVYNWYERFGVGICLGTFGYLVTGLANDSTVAVAPLYWCLLGVGLAVNRLVKMPINNGNEG